MKTQKRVIAVLISALWCMAAHAIVSASFALAATASSQAPPSLSVPADSERWQLEAQARVVDYQGRKSIMLNGGAATLKDFEMRDAIIDVDLVTPAARGYFGFQFRIAADNANAEEVYLRQHRSGYPDAMQYTPVLNNGRNWQIYNGPGFTGAVDIPKDVWFHLRLEVAGAQARLYVKDMNKPALVMTDLKSDIRKGQVALFDLTGATYFSNFEIRTTPDAPWERHLPPMPASTLIKWSLSPEYDALARDLERPLSSSESARHSVAGGGSRSPGLCSHQPLSRSPASASVVCKRLLETAGAAAGNESRLRQDQHRI